MEVQGEGLYGNQNLRNWLYFEGQALRGMCYGVWIGMSVERAGLGGNGEELVLDMVSRDVDS